MALSYSEGSYPNTGSQQPRAYAYGAGAHVLVGDGGLILRSTDLVTWTTPTSPSANDWRGIDFDGTNFVAVGAGAGLRTMISTDGGLTWAANASADETANWKDIKWAGTKWVAIASSGATRTMNSTNGTAWTGHAAASASAWTSLAYGAAIDTLVAQAIFAATNSIMYSTDKGATWNSATTLNTWKASTVASVPTVAWLSTTPAFCSIVQLTTNSTYISLTSPDGANWTAHATALPNNTEAPSFIVGSPSQAMFFAPKGCYPNVGNPMSVLSSADGVSFTETDVTAITDVTVWRAGGWAETITTLVAFDNANAYKSLIGVPAPPTVTSVFPSSGPTTGSTAVTITGTNFSGTPTVTFGGVAATSVVVVSATSITCVTPAHAIGAVTVAVDSGSLASAYTYVPVVTSIAPTYGSRHGGTVVTVTGSGFTGVTGLTFGSTAALSVTVVSDTSILCVTPAHANGLIDVVVAGTTLANAYTFIAVDRVSPKTGTVAGGTSVTITGYGFTTVPASGVTFDGLAATSVTIVSNSSITCVTPAHASGTVDVVVTGVGTGSQLYTYTLPVPQTLGKFNLLPPMPTRTPFLQGGSS